MDGFIETYLRHAVIYAQSMLYGLLWTPISPWHVTFSLLVKKGR